MKTFVLILWVTLPSGQQDAFVIDEGQSVEDCAGVLDVYTTNLDGVMVSDRGDYALACEPDDYFDAREPQ